MRRQVACLIGALLLVGAGASTASGQLSTEGPVVYGHHHIYTSSIEAQKKFWIDTLGGEDAGNLGPVPVAIVRIPGVHMLLSEQVPSGGTIGTSVNHIGFQVPDLRATIRKVTEAGYPNITREEMPPSIAVDEDGLVRIEDQDTYISFVMAPDGVKVELLENKSMSGSIVLHHVHFATPDVPGMQEWYANAFGAVPGMRGSFRAADLPGINLTFSPSSTPVKPTRLKALDHIGFEIRNLEEFARQLEAKGIELDGDYFYSDAVKLGVAFVTDPWGTRIELTEGLGEY
ncbi:MAG: VOC family protein [Acidobacteria bacterium]|nr:VOC family protein [Acidobacteriota bacterium]